MSNLERTQATTAKDPVVLGVLWAAMVGLANPLGNFPLFDDMIYAPAVETLLRTGTYVPPESTMPLVTHVLWGALISALSGANFVTLRFSTLLAGMLGLLGTYTLARAVAVPRQWALFCALLLALNPVYFALSFTFMTDVPFTVIAVWGAFWMVRFLQTQSTPYFLLGTLAAVIATLSRQTGLALSIAFALTWMLKERPTLPRLVLALAPLAASCVALQVFYRTLAAQGTLPKTYDFFSLLAADTLTHIERLRIIPLASLYVVALYLGLFLLPLLMRLHGNAARHYWPSPGLILLPLGVAVAIGGAIRMHYGDTGRLPLLGSQVLSASGVGLLWSNGRNQEVSLPPLFWLCATGLAMLGAALLALQLYTRARELFEQITRREGDPYVPMFLLLCAIVQFAPFLLSSSADRYMLPSVPFLAIGLARLSTRSDGSRGASRAMEGLGWATLVLFGLFSLASTSDYLTANRARWQALDRTLATHTVAPEEIDGGIEFDFMHPARIADPNVLLEGFGEDATLYIDLHRASAKLREELAFVASLSWRPPEVKCVLSSSALPHYRVMSTYPYRTWLPPHHRALRVLCQP